MGADDPVTMAHEITSSDSFGEVRSRGERAWHKLGVAIPDGIGARDGFQRLGLDWEVEHAPITATLADGTALELKDRFACIRSDNRADLGVVKDGYVTVQNTELAEMADLIAGQDAAIRVETAGSLNGGRRIFVLVRLPEVIKASADDLVDTYVLLSNGHGGYASFNAYPTSIRVVCANTLRMSEKDADKGVRFQHTGDMDAKLKQARTALGLVREETKRFGEMVMALVKCKIHGADLRLWMQETADSLFGPVKKGVDAESSQRLVEKRHELVEQWMQNLANERQAIRGIEGSAWAALNAVTEWMDHERGRFEEDSSARAHNNLFGENSRDKQKVLRRALELIS